MCEAEFFPGLASVAESLQRPLIRLQRDSEKACLRSESSEGIVWTVPPCQGSASLMQVRWFRRVPGFCVLIHCAHHPAWEKSTYKTSLCDTGWWKGQTQAEIYFFFICIVRQVCTQTHKVIQGNQGLQNTKSFLQITAKSLYLIRCILGLLCMKCCLLSFFVSLCGLH